MASKSERSYIQTSLLSDPPIRGDGRSLTDYRTISLATGVAPLANGSARVSLGCTDILAACKLEVEDAESSHDEDGRRISCFVSCSPSAYPHSSPSALDDMQSDLSQILDITLSHVSLRPCNLEISPPRKAWLLNLDCIILSDDGNVYDALFIAARAALWDTKVPITRPIEYKAPQRVAGDAMAESGLDARQFSHAADFELGDYWSDGAILDGRDRWPVCITLNLLSSRHFLDATALEETAIPLRLLLIFSCSTSRPPSLQGTRLMGPGEVVPSQLTSLIKEGEKYAKELVRALDTKLQSEEARRTTR